MPRAKRGLQTVDAGALSGGTSVFASAFGISHFAAAMRNVSAKGVALLVSPTAACMRVQVHLAGGFGTPVGVARTATRIPPPPIASPPSSSVSRLRPAASSGGSPFVHASPPPAAALSTPNPRHVGGEPAAGMPSSASGGSVPCVRRRRSPTPIPARFLLQRGGAHSDDEEEGEEEGEQEARGTAVGCATVLVDLGGTVPTDLWGPGSPTRLPAPLGCAPSGHWTRLITAAGGRSHTVADGGAGGCGGYVSSAGTPLRGGLPVAPSSVSTPSRGGLPVAPSSVSTPSRGGLPVAPISAGTPSRGGLPVAPSSVSTPSRGGTPVAPISAGTPSRSGVPVAPISAGTPSRSGVPVAPISAGTPSRGGTPGDQAAAPVHVPAHVSQPAAPATPCIADIPAERSTQALADTTTSSASFASLSPERNHAVQQVTSAHMQPQLTAAVAGHPDSVGTQSSIVPSQVATTVALVDSAQSQCSGVDEAATQPAVWPACSDTVALSPRQRAEPVPAHIVAPTLRPYTPAPALEFISPQRRTVSLTPRFSNGSLASLRSAPRLEPCSAEHSPAIIASSQPSPRMPSITGPASSRPVVVCSLLSLSKMWSAPSYSSGGSSSGGGGASRPLQRSDTAGHAATGRRVGWGEGAGSGGWEERRQLPVRVPVPVRACSPCPMSRQHSQCPPLLPCSPSPSLAQATVGSKRPRQRSLSTQPNSPAHHTAAQHPPHPHSHADGDWLAVLHGAVPGDEGGGGGVGAVKVTPAGSRTASRLPAAAAPSVALLGSKPDEVGWGGAADESRSSDPAGDGVDAAAPLGKRGRWGTQ